MNEKIKEILDRLDYKEWEVDLYKVPITWCELYDIRDYITNLQNRIDKAVEYIKISMNNPQPFYEYIYGDEDGKAQNLDNLLNILQGVGKDER